MIELYCQSFGASGPPLIIAHGLFGSSTNWRSIATTLAEHCRVFVPDLRNHGRSPWNVTMNYPLLATDLAEFIRRLDIEPAILLGHSMGGKAAMTLALTEPELVHKLIAVDIAPVRYAHSHLPFIKAMQRIDLGAVKSRKEAGKQLLDAIPDPGIRMFLLQNLTREENGYRWRINLDALARNMDSLIGFPDLSPRQFDDPALFVHGALSDYLQPKHRDMILNYFPNTEFDTIDNAGHWLHAEQPQPFLKAVMDFIW